jgi:photosystem II stability/assembly factor-like uncharacterized protein
MRKFHAIFTVILVLAANSEMRVPTRANALGESLDNRPQTNSICRFNSMSLARDQGIVIGGSRSKEDLVSSTEPAALGTLLFIRDSRVDVSFLQSIPSVDELYFATLDEGWIFSNGFGTFITKDRGKSVRKVSSLNGARRLLFANDLNSAWYLSENETLMRYQDGNHIQLVAFKRFPYIKKLRYADRTHGLLLAVRNGVAELTRTLDGGATWMQTKIEPTVLDFEIANYGMEFVLTSTGLLTSNDLGNTWKSIGPEAEYSFDRVFFLNRETGWVVGSKICQTQNAGVKWHCQALGSQLAREGFVGVAFTDTRNGWIVTGSAIYRSTDGGASWSRHYGCNEAK